MASQYNLELKAILDSTQVKQELQKLRVLQNQVTKSGSQVSTNVGANNLGNLTTLNSTLARLTTSLNQLNSNIAKLNTFNQRHINPSVSGASRVALPIHSFQNRFHGEEVLMDKDGSLRTRTIDYTSSKPFNTQHTKTPNTKTSNNNFIPNINNVPWYKNPMIGPLAGLALGQVADTAVRWGETEGWADKKVLGNATAGNIITTGAKIGEGIAMGSVGGVPGAVIGGVLGGVLGVFESLVRNTELFNRALQEASARVNQAFVINKNINTFFENKRDTEAVKNQDLTYLKKELDIADKEYNEAHSFIKHIIGIDNLPDYEAETKRMIASKEYEISDWQIKHRIQTADQYKQNYSAMVEADTRRTKIQSSIDAINNSNKAKEEKERTLIENQNILRSNLNQSIDDEKYNYARFNELKHLQNYIKNNDEDTIRKLISIYTDNAESSKSSYVGLLNDARSTDDIKLKELLLKQSITKKDEWSFASSQLEILTSALQSILLQPLQDRLSQLTAPDMSNVNSLAGQGVMINEADDRSREESMMNYEREQTQIQREIQQLLKDKSFTSTIM